MKNISASRALASALFLMLALYGCGPKVSAENYDRITNGMQEDKVSSILGIASESRNATAGVEGQTFTSMQSKWRNDKGTIVVVFLNGEVHPSTTTRRALSPQHNAATEHGRPPLTRRRR